MLISFDNRNLSIVHINVIGFFNYNKLKLNEQILLFTRTKDKERKHRIILVTDCVRGHNRLHIWEGSLILFQMNQTLFSQENHRSRRLVITRGHMGHQITTSESHYFAPTIPNYFTCGVSPTTFKPIERALPAIHLHKFSRSKCRMCSSAIFIFAISYICFTWTVPTKSCPGLRRRQKLKISKRLVWQQKSMEMRWLWAQQVLDKPSRA